MNKLRISIFVIWMAIFASGAGPKGYFSTEKGALIKGEVLYADDTFYYYRRVSNPEEILTVRIEDVSASFQRLVDKKRREGSITAPPDSIAREDAANDVGERPYGEWQIGETSDGDLTRHLAVLSTQDKHGKEVKLIIRFLKKESDGFQEFDVFLVFADKITLMPRWQVTYQCNDDEPIIERWVRAVNSQEAFFAPAPYGFRDRLLKSDHLSFTVSDSEGDTRRFDFDVSNFDQLYKDTFESLIIVHDTRRPWGGTRQPWGAGGSPGREYYDPEVDCIK